MPARQDQGKFYPPESLPARSAVAEFEPHGGRVGDAQRGHLRRHLEHAAAQRVLRPQNRPPGPLRMGHDFVTGKRPIAKPEADVAAIDFVRFFRIDPSSSTATSSIENFAPTLPMWSIALGSDIWEFGCCGAPARGKHRSKRIAGDELTTNKSGLSR